MNVGLSGTAPSTPSGQLSSTNERNALSISINIKNVSNKSVKFDEHITYYEVQAGGRDKHRLSLLEKVYREEVDKQAKACGLICAFGHDDPHKDPFPYNHDLGLKSMIEYSDDSNL